MHSSRDMDLHTAQEEIITQEVVRNRTKGTKFIKEGINNLTNSNQDPQGTGT